MNEYWNYYEYIKKTLNIGQTYKIKYIHYNKNADAGSLRTVKAKLIFEGKYFYTFEYKTKSGELVRTTIDKHDHKRNPSLIQGGPNA